MLAMTLYECGQPLRAERRADPRPGPGEVRLRIRACGVCRTDLHVVDGDLAKRCETIVPGHEVVGIVDAVGPGSRHAIGARLGVPWLGGTCGTCPYCRSGEENLCDAAEFTGWSRDGGYADTIIARSDFAFPISDDLTDEEAAPLLCAGLIGYRSWMKALEGRAVSRLGLYGFGAAAHLLAQLAVWSGQSVYAFTRTGDTHAQALALSLGCIWAGSSAAHPPDPLDAAIIFAPVGDLVPAALAAVRKGGIVVCGGIHMSDIPSFPYALLWEERRLISVANLTRADAHAYLPLAAKARIRPHITIYPLAEANAALSDLRNGALTGAAVLRPDSP
jgi:propanol-preferring alcohol dehydrogenase